MAAYYINSYDIIDMALFSQYPPKVIVLLEKYGATVIASDLEGIAVEGSPRMMNAIIRFPSTEAALQCYQDPDYEPLKILRQQATRNCTMVLVKAFNPS
ncbi:DUF1330 domain-containing protein [Chitinophaga qingshengii]|uniref:DUF1330 domain-containing protein n=1 Tax=Chitinophaga qingshengii TaxID=1569794 RepID=A0ABR7TNJ4_9BACT|nr:DUF1330 domain-containing protein [Chitinophaga qingshengii]MBC9931560.1 DUF1330 domain-containing protein [Chitinophaga qingshengii]